MQKLNYWYYLDKMIATENVLFANGVVGQIYFPNETNSTLQGLLRNLTIKLFVV